MSRQTTSADHCPNHTETSSKWHLHRPPNRRTLAPPVHPTWRLPRPHQHWRQRPLLLFLRPHRPLLLARPRDRLRPRRRPNAQLESRRCARMALAEQRQRPWRPQVCACLLSGQSVHPMDAFVGYSRPTGRKACSCDDHGVLPPGKDFWVHDRGHAYCHCCSMLC